MERSTVTVGLESALYASTPVAGDVNWIALDVLTAPLRVAVQTRHHQKGRPATVSPHPGGGTILQAIP